MFFDLTERTKAPEDERTIWRNKSRPTEIRGEIEVEIEREIEREVEKRQNYKSKHQCKLK